MPADGRPQRPVRVAVALGSNLGDRAAHLSWAVDQLARVLDDLRVSAFEETAPLDVPDLQPDYLNAVAVGRCRGDDDALQLLRVMLLDPLEHFETVHDRHHQIE